MDENAVLGVLKLKVPGKSLAPFSAGIPRCLGYPQTCQYQEPEAQFCRPNYKFPGTEQQSECFILPLTFSRVKTINTTC